MSTPITNVEIADFLAQNAWLRRLVARLVAPEHVDDVVQDTFVQLATHPPRHSDSPRGWLAQVARNMSRMRARSSARRHDREQAADTTTAIVDPEVLVGRAQRLRLLSKLVETLDEPSRSTVLLHYFEGLPLAEIARQTATPDGTVRWRLHTALRKLRERLDTEHGGDRTVWLSAFAPLGTVPKGGFSTAAIGASMSKLTKIIATTAILGVGVAAATTSTAEPSTARDTEPTTVAAASAPVTAAAVSVSDGDTTDTRQKDQTTTRARRPTPSKPVLPRHDRTPAVTDEAEDETEQDPEMLKELRRDTVLDQVERDDDSPLSLDDADAQTLTDIEQMLWLENAFGLSRDCAEASPPKVQSLMYVEVEFRGTPGLSSVVEAVTIDSERTDPGFGEFGRCIEEGLFELHRPPMELDETRLLRLFFDTTGEQVVAGFDADAPPL